MSEPPVGRARIGSPSGDGPSPLDVAYAIDEWFRSHVGIPIGSTHVEGGREWCLRRLDGSGEPLLVRVTREALDPQWADLDRSLEAVATDARTNPPDPPGYYLVGRDGMSVRGMIRFAWHEYGQDIRCYICSRLSAPTGEVRESREWRVSVDHVDRGSIRGTGMGDDRDTVQRLAMEHLRRTDAIRVPPPYWTWSILDADDREWWGRLEVRPVGSEIQLIQASSRRQRRLPWDPGMRPPTPAELRAIVSRVRHT